MTDEFYIGYEGPMPPGMARQVRRVVLAAIAVALSVALLAVATQRPLADSRFAFGELTTHEGWYVRGPAPSLLVPDSGGWSRVWLVAEGKHGAEALLHGVAEGWVRIEGTLIERAPWRMVEIAHGRLQALERAGSPPPAADARAVSFAGRGEIVDSKCYLGVMNPGEHVVHRDCAERCISGGVPPMFAFRDETGAARLAAIVLPGGRPAGPAVRGAIGYPVRLEGRLHSALDAEVLVLDAIHR
jgi:hypothetical protein